MRANYGISGAGTARCVLANRFSEVPTAQILLKSTPAAAGGFYIHSGFTCLPARCRLKNCRGYALAMLNTR